MALNPQNLTPFEKGKSGNPAGRTPGIPNSKTRLKRLLELTQDLKNPVTGEVEGFSVMEQIDMKLIQKARNGDLKAIGLLLDRLEGKAAQSMDLTTNGKDLPTPILRLEDVSRDDSNTETSETQETN